MKKFLIIYTLILCAWVGVAWAKKKPRGTAPQPPARKVPVASARTDLLKVKMEPLAVKPGMVELNFSAVHKDVDWDPPSQWVLTVFTEGVKEPVYTYEWPMFDPRVGEISDTFKHSVPLLPGHYMAKLELRNLHPIYEKDGSLRSPYFPVWMTMRPVEVK